MAVVGGGPIGLEAALAAGRSGLETIVFESGEVGESLRQWAHVRLFSPFGLNSSPLGREAVGGDLPDRDALLSGREFVEAYLEPLAEAVAETATVQRQSRVVAISRQRTWKHHLVGRRDTAGDRFRLLVETPGGEVTEEADIVLDCSGTWGHHGWIGAGGIACPGERRLLCRRDYLLPDIEGVAADEFAGRHTLLVGSGHSAATSLVALARLATRAAGTRVTWITRATDGPPLSPIDDDPLPARGSLVAEANRLAIDPDADIDWRPGDRVLRIEEGSGQFLVHVEGQGGTASVLEVERILGNVGFRPDRSLYEELQVHECYATGGPIRLAAALMEETAEDCLEQEAGELATLQSPEPGFFILGSKSYGRDSRFLLKVGIEQVGLVIDHVLTRFGAGVL